MPLPQLENCFEEYLKWFEENHCEEKDNVFVQFITEEKYQRTFTLVFMALLENL